MLSLEKLNYEKQAASLDTIRDIKFFRMVTRYDSEENKLVGAHYIVDTNIAWSQTHINLKHKIFIPASFFIKIRQFEHFISNTLVCTRHLS